MLDHMEYSTYSGEGADAETYSSSSPMRNNNTKKKKKSMNTRRFSDEQIKSLESMFETESRLEPRKKLQLARELGLQPRQVAIWFQNKRARWKSKQLERDYSILTNSFNSLNSKFEALKKEKQALLIQLQKLNDIIQKPLDKGQSHSTKAKASNSNNMDSESENGDTTKSEPDLRPSTSSIMQTSTTEHHHVVLGALSDDDTSIKVEYFNKMEDEPAGLLNFAEHGGDGSLTSPEDWGTFESDDILGQSTSDYQWWDFWS